MAAVSGLCLIKPGKLDLPTIWRGCDWGPVTLKWKDANGVAINVQAWTPRAQSLNINLNAQKTGSPPGILGETTLSLTKDDTLNLKLGTESWDWIWEHVSPTTGLVDYRFPPFLSGKICIKESQTSITPGGLTTPPIVGDPPTFGTPP